MITREPYTRARPAEPEKSAAEHKPSHAGTVYLREKEKTREARCMFGSSTETRARNSQPNQQVL